MYTSLKPWWSSRFSPFSWPGPDGHSKKAARLAVRVALFLIVLSPAWAFVAPHWLKAVSFVSQHALNFLSPYDFQFRIEIRDYSIVAGMIKRGWNGITFGVSSAFILIGWPLTMALVASSPLEPKRLLKAAALSTAIIFAIDVYFLMIAVKCPFSLLGRPMTPDELRYVDLMRPWVAKLTSYANIFNQTIAWQLFPLTVWAGACWRKWL